MLISGITTYEGFIKIAISPLSTSVGYRHQCHEYIFPVMLDVGGLEATLRQQLSETEHQENSRLLIHAFV